MAQGATSEELLARVVAREEDALGELYDRLAPGLLGMLVRILSDRGAAEQVLQDVFLRFWNEARRHGRERGSVVAWLVLMARSAAIERLRAQRKLAALARTGAEATGKSLACLPRAEVIALLDQRRDLLKKVLSQLPKPQREALELAVFEGYTETEIAQKLGEPLARVKTGLRAGMSFLRHRLRAVLGTWAANI